MPGNSVVGEPRIEWQEGGKTCGAHWRSERGAPPPKKVVLADDTLSADAAYRLACEGTALLWRGDFQNARQMLQALGRRIDQSASTDKRGRKLKPKPLAVPDPKLSLEEAAALAAKGFHLHRQAQAQRARVLGMVLLSFDADYGLNLRRSPDARQACSQAWGAPTLGEGEGCIASMRELLGLISAFEWRKNGVEIAALGEPPNNRVFPHYGVYSPLRGEYVSLVATAPLKTDLAALTVFDIGTGTGVLAAVLARRGVGHVIATDLDARALACSTANLAQLGVTDKVELLQTNLYPPGQADVVVCNPPWLPARPSSPIEHAIYDEGSGMLLGFLNGLVAHLKPQGEGWLILSDLAEHLGLRSRAELLQAFANAGLRVVARMDTKPVHGKATDATDPLHQARSREVTSLWRLAAA